MSLFPLSVKRDGAGALCWSFECASTPCQGSKAILQVVAKYLGCLRHQALLILLLI